MAAYSTVNGNTVKAGGPSPEAIIAKRFTPLSPPRRLPSVAHGERGPVRPACRTMCSDRSRGIGRLRAQSATSVCAPDCIEQGPRWSGMLWTARLLIVLPADC